MASAHSRSDTRGRPPPKRWVFTCFRFVESLWKQLLCIGNYRHPGFYHCLVSSIFLVARTPATANLCEWSDSRLCSSPATDNTTLNSEPIMGSSWPIQRAYLCPLTSGTWLLDIALPDPDI